MMKRSRTVRSERGAAAVEFALLVPVLCMVLFGIISFGIVFANDLAMGNGAREAARFAVVDGNTCTDIVNSARAASSSVNVNTNNVQVDIYVGADKAAAKSNRVCLASPGAGVTPAANATKKPCQGTSPGAVVYVVVYFKAKLVIPLVVVDQTFPVSGEGVFKCEFS